MQEWHRPVAVIIDDRRECRICGKPVIGFGDGLRHAGERAAVQAPNPEHAEGVAAAVRVGTRALQGVTPGVSAEEESRLVVTALYTAGLLAPKRR